MCVSGSEYFVCVEMGSCAEVDSVCVEVDCACGSRSGAAEVE